MKKTFALTLIAATAATAFAADPVIENGVIVAPPTSAAATLYSRNSVGMEMDMFGRFENFEYYGYAQDLYRDGTDVYLQDPCCTFLYGGFIKGTEDASGISFPMPQPVFYYDYEGKQETFYVDIFYFDPLTGQYERDTEEGRTYDLDKNAQGQYKFDYLSVIQDGNLFYTARMLGVVEGKTGQWMGFSDLTSRLLPFDPTLPTPPASLNAPTKQFIYGLNGYTVNIGREGNDLYIQGLLELNPQTWAKGSINGNTATFKSGTYLGIADGKTIFMTQTDISPYTPDAEITTGDVTLTYDAATDTWNGKNVWLCAGPELDEDYVYYPTVTIKDLNPDPLPDPAKPYIVNWFNFDSTIEFGRITFELSSLNTQGDLLDIENLSYALFFDDEIYTLDPADYKRLPEEMEWIPANFHDNWDIYVYDRGLRNVYFYAEVDNNLSVQTRYLAPDGTLHYSKKAYVYTENSVDGLNDDLQIVSETNYNLNGMAVAPDAPGLKIRVYKMSDGSVKTEKVFKTR